MTIPNYQDFMNPILEVYAGLESETRPKDIETKVADMLNISEEDRLLMLKDGKRSVVYSRIDWSAYYMYIAGLLYKPRRGFYKITDEGIRVFKSGVVVNNNLLKQYPSYVDFWNVDSRTKDNKSSKDIDGESPETRMERAIKEIEKEDPETRMERAIKEIEEALKDEILTSLRIMDPKKFEQTVVDLMIAMNYGIGKTTQYSHDGGIDGIIDEDELGLSRIYLQAKRYSEGKIQEREMRDFMGALADKPVSKGVFITTVSFSDKAVRMAKDSKHHAVRLIDGTELVDLMIKHNLGVRLKKGYEIKEIDNSYFED